MIGSAAAAWRRWRARLSIGILDQAAFSGANFVLNVLVARWLPPATYGAFAIAYAALVLVGGLHGALLVDPLNVVGARRAERNYGPYLRAVVTIHAVLTVPLGVLVALAGRFASSLALPSGWLVALGIATPVVLLLWLLRSACYLVMRPGLALLGSVVYAACLMGLLTWAHVGAWLTAPMALLQMGVASAVASLCMVLALGLHSRPETSPALASVAREHWSYGRWILGAAAAHGVAYGLYVPIVGVLAGLEPTAVLRALQNLVAPLQQVLAGVALVAYPFMSRQVARQGPGYLNRRGPTFVVLTAAVAAAYGVTIAALGRPLLTAIYGPGYYAAYASLLWPFALAALLAAVAQCLSILVRVVNRPQAVLWSKLAAAAWLAGVGLILVRRLGVRGAVLSLSGAAFVEALVLALGMKRGVSADTVVLPPVPVEDVV